MEKVNPEIPLRSLRVLASDIIEYQSLSICRHRDTRVFDNLRYDKLSIPLAYKMPAVWGPRTCAQVGLITWQRQHKNTRLTCRLVDAYLMTGQRGSVGVTQQYTGHVSWPNEPQYDRVRKNTLRNNCKMLVVHLLAAVCGRGVRAIFSQDNSCPGKCVLGSQT